MAKKLYKSNKNKMIFGVCSGLAEYFNVDVTIMRIIFIILAFLSGSGLILYIICALIMPNRDRFDDVQDVENLKRANVDPDETVNNDKKNPKNPNAHSDEDFDSYFKK